MLVKFDMLYGGKKIIDKKDKETKKPTGEKTIMVNLFAVDEKAQFVENKTCFIKEDFDDTKLEILKPRYATFDISATSNFQTLITVEPKK